MNWYTCKYSFDVNVSFIYLSFLQRVRGRNSRKTVKRFILLCFQHASLESMAEEKELPEAA